MNKYRADFSNILNKTIYFDNASTTQKPLKILEKINNYYKNNNGSPDKGVYKLSVNSEKIYEEARENVAKFIGTNSENVFFTSGATDSLNQIAYGLEYLINKGDEVVVTELEHHSNLLPWIRCARTKKAKLKYINVKKNGALDYSNLKKIITNKTKIIAFSACSNVTGEIINVEKIVKIAKKVRAITVLDAVQLIPHKKINTQKLNVDFLVISGHKMLSPNGIGIVYGKKLELLKPFKIGGGIVNEVSQNNYKLVSSPNVFESGTVNVAGAIGLSDATKYYNENNIYKSNIETELLLKLINELSKLDFVNIIAKNINRVATVSFIVQGIHPHDVSQYLAEKNISIRAGHHCAKLLHKALGITATNRVSLMFYNTKKEIALFINELKNMYNFFCNIMIKNK